MHDQPSKNTPGSEPTENPKDATEMSSADLYAKIVREIQGFEPVSVIGRGIAWLNDPVKPDTGSPAGHSDIEAKNVMLAIRWAYQHHELGGGTDALSIDGLRKLSHNISELEFLAENEKNSAEEPHDWPHIDYHLRPHQNLRLETGSSIFRQMILFDDILGRTKLGKKFGAKYRISMSRFIRIYTMCCAHVFGRQKISISQMRDDLGEDDINNFLGVVARDFDGASEWMKEYTKQHSEQGEARKGAWLQLREPTPLVRIPFFRDGDNLVPYSLAILETGLRENLYEMLKDLRIGFPGQYLSWAYESYIKRMTQKLKLASVFGERLKKMLGDGPCADGVVFDNETCVIIEVKSTAPSRREMAEQDMIGAGVSARDRILEGVEQIAHTASRLKVPDKRSIFGLVVTYGKYEHTWRTIGDTAHGEARKKLECLGNPIRTSQCFFLDIDDFEHLVEETLEPLRGFGNTLRKLADRQSQGGHFAFKRELGHIVGEKELATPRWLLARMEAWQKEIASRGSI